MLYESLSKLSNDERNLIMMIYFKNKTELECADLLHTTQQNVHKKKKKILAKLNKLLKKQKKSVVKCLTSSPIQVKGKINSFQELEN